jgi:hypothetical protein
LEKAELLEKNEFSKTYRKGSISIYIAKAYDEETAKHFVVISIPAIEHLNVLKVQLPIAFDYAEQRDMFFDGFEPDAFMPLLEQKILDNRKISEN